MRSFFYADPFSWSPTFDGHGSLIKHPSITIVILYFPYVHELQQGPDRDAPC